MSLIFAFPGLTRTFSSSASPAKTPSGDNNWIAELEADLEDDIAADCADSPEKYFKVKKSKKGWIQALPSDIQRRHMKTHLTIVWLLRTI